MFNLPVALTASAGLWILFVAGVKPQEMVVGSVCVLLTVAFTYYVATRASVKIHLRLSDIVQIWRVPGYLIAGTSEILIVLVKDILHIAPAGSFFRATRFENNATPVGLARRVLAVAYNTATPNSIVVGIDRKTHRILFHQVKRSGVRAMTRRLGAQ